MASYEYDALGRRVVKKLYDSNEDVDKIVRYYHNDRWQILHIDTNSFSGTTETDEMNQEFLYGNGIDEPLIMFRKEENSITTDKYYYYGDNLNSTVALVKDDGTIAERYSYNPWGEPTITDGVGNLRTESDIDNPFMFTAREVDILDGGNLKLQHNRWRVYNYKLARWIQNDPLGTVPEGYMNRFNPRGQYKDGINIYQYVKSNSVVGVDKLGLLHGLFPPGTIMGGLDRLFSTCKKYKCCSNGGCTSELQCKTEAIILFSKYVVNLNIFMESRPKDHTWVGYKNFGLKKKYVTCEEYQEEISSWNITNGLSCWNSRKQSYIFGNSVNDMHHFVALVHACNKSSDSSDAILDPWVFGDWYQLPSVVEGKQNNSIRETGPFDYFWSEDSTEAINRARCRMKRIQDSKEKNPYPYRRPPMF